MLPELYKLAEEMPHINVVKFNCNKQNKDLVGAGALWPFDWPQHSPLRPHTALRHA